MIYFFGEAVPHKSLRCGILRYTPTVRIAELILEIDKVAYDDIALCLKSGDYRIKARVAALLIISELL